MAKEEFEAKFDSKLLTNVIDITKAIFNEGHLLFRKDALIIQGIDPGRICLMIIQISKDDFEDYTYIQDLNLAVNFDDVKKVMDRSSGFENTTIKFNEHDKIIKFIMSGKNRSKTHNLKAIDLSLDESVKPDRLDAVQMLAKWSMPLGYLNECIKDADIYSESIYITFDSNELIFKADGSIGMFETTLSKDDELFSQYELIENEEGIRELQTAEFSLHYLKYLLKTSLVAENVSLSMISRIPLKFEVFFGSSSYVKYYLAPRVEDNDDEEDDYDEKMEEESK